MKKSTGISVFIAILFALFVGFAINQWYPEPEYPDCYREPGMVVYDEKPVQADNFDWETDCKPLYDQYDIENEQHSKITAIILVVIGLAAVVFGVKGKSFEEYIHIGLLWGGILVTIYGVIEYWDYFDDNFKPLLIGVVLVGVIYFGNKYKKYLK